MIASLQLLLAPWFLWYYPEYHYAYDIGPRLPAYLGYGGPVVLIFAAGLILPLVFKWKSQGEKSSSEKDSYQPEQLRKALDRLLVIGVAAAVISPPVPDALMFVMELVKSLRFPAVFGFVILGLPGWKSRTIFITALEFFGAVSSGMFGMSTLWLASLFFLFAYKERWGRRVLMMMLLGFLSLLVLQQLKVEHRKYLWYGKSDLESDRVTIFVSFLWDALLNPEETFSPYNMRPAFRRFNQGWIVNRVMLWVPAREPFAEGELLKREILSSLVPRFMAEEKYRAGGREEFERYTGHELFDASMGLGYAGDMYANFGHWGGIAGVGLYALLLGIGYRWVYVRALRYPLWWAWAVYVGIVALKAEDSVGFVLNWIVKATVVAAAVIWYFSGDEASAVSGEATDPHGQAQT